MRQDILSSCAYAGDWSGRPHALGGGSPTRHSALLTRVGKRELDRRGTAELPLWMAYQPIVSWARGEIVAHEALLRTHEHPDACPQGVFGSARKLGIAGRLGQRVRASVARTLATLPGEAQVFVNIEREDLTTDALLAPDDPLAAFASRVVLEINEGGACTDPAGLDKHLEPLRDLGYRIALDDLGAGHNGLAAFAENDFDVAKIDMSLVRGIASSRTKQRVVEFIYELCASRKVLCITEGVESKDELETLVHLGGELFQGFLFGRPGCLDSRPRPCRAS